MEVSLVRSVDSYEERKRSERETERRRGTLWRRWFTAVGKTIRVAGRSSVYFKNTSEHRGTLEISTDVTAVLLEIYTWKHGRAMIREP